MSETFDRWADRMLEGARLPSEVVRFALRRHLDVGVRRAAEHRFRGYSDVDLREGVPALVALLLEETGVTPVEPGWEYAPGKGPWPAKRKGHVDRSDVIRQPLRGARHDLTGAEKRALHVRAGGCDSDWRGPNGWEFQRVDGPGGPATPALTACELLARTQDSRAAPALVAVLAGAKVASSVRRAAGRALLGLEAPCLVDAAPACIAIVDDDRDGEACLRVRWAAVRLLGRIGSPAADPAVPALVKFLFEDGGLVLPPLAALALGGIGTVEARGALERMGFEIARGATVPERRRSVDLELIQRAVAAALDRDEALEVRDLEDEDFEGWDRRRKWW